MITITINGKKLDREFPFMSQALAWVYQSGECHAAQKIEIAFSDTAKDAKPIEPCFPRRVFPDSDVSYIPPLTTNSRVEFAVPANISPRP